MCLLSGWRLIPNGSWACPCYFFSQLFLGLDECELNVAVVLVRLTRTSVPSHSLASRPVAVDKCLYISDIHIHIYIYIFIYVREGRSAGLSVDVCDRAGTQHGTFPNRRPHTSPEGAPQHHTRQPRVIPGSASPVHKNRWHK